MPCFFCPFALRLVLPLRQSRTSSVEANTWNTILDLFFHCVVVGDILRKVLGMELGHNDFRNLPSLSIVTGTSTSYLGMASHRLGGSAPGWRTLLNVFLEGWGAPWLSLGFPLLATLQVVSSAQVAVKKFFEERIANCTSLSLVFATASWQLASCLFVFFFSWSQSLEAVMSRRCRHFINCHITTLLNKPGFLHSWRPGREGSPSSRLHLKRAPKHSSFRSAWIRFACPRFRSGFRWPVAWIPKRSPSSTAHDWSMGNTVSYETENVRKRKTSNCAVTSSGGGGDDGWSGVEKSHRQLLTPFFLEGGETVTSFYLF